jgi:DNA-directed RNA polymerase specialized sigma subunit
MTQESIAEAMYLNKSTVCDIQKKALEKMRKILAERGISAKDLLEDK